MKATAEEIANRPVAKCLPGQTLRLLPDQVMTLPKGKAIPIFKDTYTKDPEHGYCLGVHPSVTPDEHTALKALTSLTRLHLHLRKETSLVTMGHVAHLKST